MTIEQDFLLSAFFDGEVDADQSRRVEAAVASDPATAETLRALGAVHDLVAALSRPRPPDLSARVLDRIAADDGRRRLWKSWRPYLGRGLGATAAAACLGLIVLRGADRRMRELPVPSPTRILDAMSPSQALASRPPASTAVPTPPDEVGPPTAALLASRPASPPLAPTVAVAPPRPARVQPAGFQELWTNDEPRRDFVVTSAPGEAAAEVVASLLSLSTHRDFYRVAVPAGADAQGDVDATAPVAFAARLDPSEYRTLRGRLESKFPGRIGIGDSEPETAGLLADVGRATALAAAPAGEVSFPQTEQALLIHSDRSSQPRVEDEPAADPPASASVPPPPTDPTGSATVLVWIVGPAAN